MSKNKEVRTAVNLERGLALLSGLIRVGKPVNFAEAVQLSDAGKALTMTLLQTLVQCGYVVESDGRYTMSGPAILPLNNPSVHQLVAAAKDPMKMTSQETGQTTSMAILFGDLARVVWG